MLLLISLSLFSFLSFADCKVAQGNKMITIKESSEVSLYQPGKSLENHEIQDQDGLATCYANTGSTVLQSVLPLNPKVSYLHMALEGSTNGNLKNWRRGGKYVLNDNNKEIDNIASYGNICDSIMATKASGGACSAYESILESNETINPHLQNSLMINLGKYFDFLNEATRKPDELKKIKNHLAKTINEVRYHKDELLSACEENKADIPIKRAVVKLLELEILKTDTKDKCGEIKLKNIKAIIGNSSFISKDRVRVDLTPETLKKLNVLINKDKFFSEIDENSSRDIIGDKIKVFVRNTLPATEDLKNCPMANDSFKILSKDVGGAFMDQMKVQKETNCEEYVKGFDAVEALKSEKFCLSLPGLDPLLKALVPLVEAGIVAEEGIDRKLASTDSAYAEQFKKIILPGCMDKSNLLPLEGVSCNTFSMCEKSNNFEPKFNKYTGPKNGCYDPAAARKLFQKTIVQGINSNRALGIGVCTGFMIDPDVKTDFCRKEAKGIEGHGFHAMSISGYRCQEGRLQYEIVNSWGKENCPAKKENGYKNKAVECVLDEEGKPTGKFWVKEDVLVDNSINVTEVKLDAK